MSLGHLAAAALEQVMGKLPHLEGKFPHLEGEFPHLGGQISAFGAEFPHLDLNFRSPRGPFLQVWQSLRRFGTFVFFFDFLCFCFLRIFVISMRCHYFLFVSQHFVLFCMVVIDLSGICTFAVHSNA